MANWEKYAQDIMDYVDDLLPSEAKRELANTIESNPEVKQHYNEIKSLRHHLKSLPSIKTSADFDTVLRSRIQMEKSLGKYGIPFRAMRLPVVAAVGALAMVILIFANGPSGPGGPTTLSPNSDTFVGSAASSGTGSLVVRNPASRRAVNYPIDRVRLPVRGVAIESANIPGRTGPDSLSMTQKNGQRILPVEF